METIGHGIWIIGVFLAGLALFGLIIWCLDRFEYVFEDIGSSPIKLCVILIAVSAVLCWIFTSAIYSGDSGWVWFLAFISVLVNGDLWKELSGEKPSDNWDRTKNPERIIISPEHMERSKRLTGNPSYIIDAGPPHITHPDAFKYVDDSDLKQLVYWYFQIYFHASWTIISGLILMAFAWNAWIFPLWEPPPVPLP